MIKKLLIKFSVISLIILSQETNEPEYKLKFESESLASQNDESEQYESESEASKMPGINISYRQKDEFEQSESGPSKRRRI